MYVGLAGTEEVFPDPALGVAVVWVAMEVTREGCDTPMAAPKFEYECGRSVGRPWGRR